MLCLRFDLSMAEARILGILSHDPAMMALARSKPWDFDLHKHNASIVFQKNIKDVTKEERYAAKRIVHGSGYGMQPSRMSDSLLDEGFIIPPDECERLQNNYLAEMVGVAQYQLRTRMMVIETKKLVNSYGFSIEFKHERRDEQLWRRAYAWRCQSEIGYKLNQDGILPAWDFIQRNSLNSKIMFQVHDEIAIAVPNVTEAWDLAQLLHETLEEEQEYESERLSIPADCALETRYHGRERFGEVVEFKRFPDRDAFGNAFEELWQRRVS
jgi:DNA polymerase I